MRLRGNLKKFNFHHEGHEGHEEGLPNYSIFSS